MLFRCLTVVVFAVVSVLPTLPTLAQLHSVIAALSLLFVFVVTGIGARGLPHVFRLFFLIACACWAIYWGALQLQQRLPLADEPIDIQVSAVVISSQRRQADRQTVEVDVIDAVDGRGKPLMQIPRRLKLSRTLSSRRLGGGPFDTAAAPLAPLWRQGEAWQFWVRLKPPRGFANLGGFDYERWLLARGIDATGYVKSGKSQMPRRRVELDDDFYRWVGQLKQRLSRRYGEGVAASTLAALAFGDRSGLSLDQHQLLQHSGLSHLLAISGLHVGLAAVFGAFVGRYLGFVLVCWRPLVFYGPVIGLWVGVIFAIAYAAVAGFSLATQRALIMLLVAALWLSLYRRYSPWLAWWWSLLAVLILQPLSLYEPGFWFSFVAVAVLMLLSGGRMTRWRQRLVFVVKAQCLLFLCLLCLQWYLGSSVSVLSPLANFLAIPFVSLLVVPQILLALMVSVFSWELSQFFWSGAHHCLTFFWTVIHAIEPWVDASVLPSPPGVLQGGNLGLASIVIPIALVFMILPFAFVYRAMAVFILCSVLMGVRAEDSHPHLFVLDVGQGLSVVATSRGRGLLYDTGPEYSTTFNAGEAVVIPFLVSRQQLAIDLAVISHWDSDHFGGYDLVDQSLEVGRWLVSELSSPRALKLEGFADECALESIHELGGWRITVLGYSSRGKAMSYEKRNDRSCVLLLDFEGFRVLLPGDIERVREMQLLSHPQLQQPVDVMIAPHHGSGTSSSQIWVSQLRPSWVVYSSGYGNRYGHPQDKVQKRYEQVGAVSFNTAHHGSLHFQVDDDGNWGVEGYRQTYRRYWR